MENKLSECVRNECCGTLIDKVEVSSKIEELEAELELYKKLYNELLDKVQEVLVIVE